jgi:hypothetical protein
MQGQLQLQRTRQVAGSPPPATAAAALAAASLARPSRPCSCRSKRRAHYDGPVIDKDYVAPAVGWMWDTSSGSSGRDTSKAPMTARSLKAANIKAKK